MLKFEPLLCPGPGGCGVYKSETTLYRYDRMLISDNINPFDSREEDFEKYSSHINNIKL